MVSMKNSENRKITQALVTFLLKMRTGHSNNCISAILGITENQVWRSIDSVLKCFIEDLLPQYFRVNAYSRKFFITNTSDVANCII